eukprot:2566964-Prymnesium_polylepis.1
MGTVPQRAAVPIAGAVPRLCDAIQQCGPSRWVTRGSAPRKTCFQPPTAVDASEMIRVSDRR